jgi:hypothetical protein
MLLPPIRASQLQCEQSTNRSILVSLILNANWSFEMRPVMAAAASRLPPFPHRHKFDGSHTSICTKCFVAVVTSVEEADLLSAEPTHICQGLKLGRVLLTPDRK